LRFFHSTSHAGLEDEFWAFTVTFIVLGWPRRDFPMP
jgi:hypothetical protein